jgi:hypothetical protein
VAGCRAIGARGRCGGESCQYGLASVRIALRALRVSKLRSALTMQGKLGQADEQAAEISMLLQDRRTVIRADLRALIPG